MIGRCLLFVTALLLGLAESTSGKVASIRASGFGPFDYLRGPPAPPTSRDGAAETLMFDQRLDHTDTSNKVTWKQRYFRNTAYHRRGGPVMLFLSGESEADDGWVQGGQMVNIAAQLGGLCLEIEHRYYGQSRPTPNLTTENLRFLTPQQALGDVAYFVRWYRQQHQNVSDVPWVVFGGSYAGNLAAWARLKYPELITAAVASSAPVQANVTFPEYLEVVGEVVGAADAQCLRDIQSASAEFESLVKTQPGADKVRQYYRLCSELNITRQLDVTNVANLLTLLFAQVVQSESNTVIEDVKRRCASIRSLTGTPLQRMAKAYLQNVGVNSDSQCFDGSFASRTESQLAINYSARRRQWTYQLCSQFGYFVTMDSDKQPFGHLAHASYNAAMCTAIFGELFNLERTRSGVAATNAEYGGRKPNVTNVVFVNGGLDPWHRLGVVKDLSATAVAVLISDGSHCTDQQDDDDADSAALRAGRARIRELVTSWTRKRQGR